MALYVWWEVLLLKNQNQRRNMLWWWKGPTLISGDKVTGKGEHKLVLLTVFAFYDCRQLLFNKCCSRLLGFPLNHNFSSFLPWKYTEYPKSIQFLPIYQKLFTSHNDINKLDYIINVFFFLKKKLFVRMRTGILDFVHCFFLFLLDSSN